MHAYQLVDSCMGRRLWSGEGAASVACHAQCNGLFAYAGGGQLCTRTAESLVKVQEIEVCVPGCPAMLFNCMKQCVQLCRR